MRAAILLLATLGSASAFLLSTSPSIAGGQFVRGCSANKNCVRSPHAVGGVASLKAVLGAESLIHGLDPIWLTHVFTGLADAADTVTEAVAEETKSGGGFFELLTTGTENAITGLHDILEGVGIAKPYGLAIIMFTLFIKAVTFPLTYQQLSSSTKMQALTPKVKDLQKRYANNPEVANKMIAELYQTENVNPLAGCLPSLAQIPIFIALYRALSNLAKDDKLTEPFLWIPSLEGPVFQAPPAESLNWLNSGWQDGAPPLGWHDTLCYLSIPLILVITQSISQQLMQPPRDPSKEEEPSQAVLKFLPLMIGYFSLNVPAGLGVYWIVNNFVSTAATLFIRNQVEKESAALKASRFTGGESTVVDVESADVPRTARMEASRGFGVQNEQDDNEAGEEEVIIADPTPTASRKSSKKKKARKGKR